MLVPSTYRAWGDAIERILQLREPALAQRVSDNEEEYREQSRARGRMAASFQRRGAASVLFDAERFRELQVEVDELAAVRRNIHDELLQAAVDGAILIWECVEDGNIAVPDAAKWRSPEGQKALHGAAGYGIPPRLPLLLLRAHVEMWAANRSLTGGVTGRIDPAGGAGAPLPAVIRPDLARALHDDQVGVEGGPLDPTQQINTEGALSRVERPKPTNPAVRKWFRDRVQSWRDDLPAPSEQEDWTAASAFFDKGLGRDDLRQVRALETPPEWQKQGRRKRWGLVKSRITKSAENSAKLRPQN
jgi:hypothetical protein